MGTVWLEHYFGNFAELFGVLDFKRVEFMRNLIFVRIFDFPDFVFYFLTYIQCVNLVQ